MRSLAVDVAVIGAGPSGSAAAIRLSEMGVDVVLVDRATFPREKVCGDGLTPRAILSLEELGVWTAVQSHAAPVTDLAILDMATGVQHRGLLPSRTPTGPNWGAVVPRRVLDDALRARAVSKGVRFLPGTMMTSIERRRCSTIRLDGAGQDGGVTLVSRAVIVADGADGAIGRLCRRTEARGMNGVAVRQYWHLRGVAPAFHVCTPLVEDGQPLAGYGWVFPLRNGIANVGVGLVSTPLNRNRVRGVFERFARALGDVVPEWHDARPLGRLSGGRLRSGMDPDAGSMEGTLLVGDAVGAINPFTGEGIAQAMETGRIAAEAMAAHLGDPCRLRAAYRAGLLAAFPETTMNVASQPWLIDRGRLFGGEFWRAVSRPTSLLGRSVRRIVLDEKKTRAVSDRLSESLRARTERSWRLLECRMAVSRPLVAQVLRMLRWEDSAAEAAMAQYWRTLREYGRDGVRHAEVVALALGALAMCMALTADRSPGDLAPQDRTIERRARWADDATAIGVADVLLALLFTLLSRLPPRISGHCAAGALVGLQHLESSEDGTPGAVTAQQDAAAVFAGCLMPDSSLVA